MDTSHDARLMRRFFLSALVLAATATPWALGADTSVPELIRAAGSGAEAARISAIDQLGARGEKAAEAVAGLSQLLLDGSANVRAHAVRALGQIGAPARPAAAAIANLLKDKDETVRRQTVTALAAIRPGPQVMVPLVVQMLEDGDPGVQMRIMHAISEAGPAAMPSLIEALKDDRAAYWACLILRDIGPAAKEAVPALAEKLKSQKPEVRREAALTLGTMQEAAIGVLPQIAALLDDPHGRAAATFALGQIGRIPPGAQARIQANAKSDDKFLSTVSYWTLARANPTDKQLHREAAERTVERLLDPDVHVRVMAAQSLAALPPAPDIMLPIWEKVLATADETTAQYALDALATLGPAAVPRLIDYLKHKSVRAKAIYVLGQIGPPAAAATDGLAKLVNDDDSQVATEAVLALASIGPAAKAAVPALTNALGNEDSTHMHAVVYALGKIGSGASAAEPKLSELLKSKDPSLAIASAWAITQIQPGSPASAGKALPVLIAGLGDPYPESRQAAVQALGSLGPLAKSALPALQKLASDEDAVVREAAAMAVQQIQAQPAR